MSSGSHYEINVSKGQSHIFRAELTPNQSLQGALSTVNLLKQKFPESEGYDVDMTYWECRGRSIEL